MLYKDQHFQSLQKREKTSVNHTQSFKTSSLQCSRDFLTNCGELGSYSLFPLISFLGKGWFISFSPGTYSAGIWQLDIQSKFRGGRRVVIFGLLMLGQQQEGLAAIGVYARESWHGEWRKDLADE